MESINNNLNTGINNNLHKDTIIKKEATEYYFYNPFQADYFIKNGVPTTGAGKGNKGDVYIKFPINEYSKEVYERWCKLCNLIK